MGREIMEPGDGNSNQKEDGHDDYEKEVDDLLSGGILPGGDEG